MWYTGVYFKSWPSTYALGQPRKSPLGNSQRVPQLFKSEIGVVPGNYRFIALKAEGISGF